MGQLIHAVGHGLAADDTIMLGNLVGGEGLTENTVYYVLASGLTADDFKISLTSGGTPEEFTTDITDGVIVMSDSYVPISDGIQDPPDPVPTPSAPSVGSLLIGGVVRLSVLLNDTAEAKVREWRVEMTHKFDIPDPVNFPDVGDWDWDKAMTMTLPWGATEFSIPALGSTIYATRVKAVDVYGQESSYSTVVEATTVAGSDAVAAALADIANDISFQITETQIADDAISTPKLQANSVTADVLAAVLTISSLIRTAASGGRVELDVDGIRLYASDETLTVRIPTDGSTAYFKGEIAAANLTNAGLTELADNVALTGDAVMTLANGVQAPTVAPTMVASLDSKTIASTPTGSTAGIGYDAHGGGGDTGIPTILIAADPASGYVFHEYVLATGALVRSVPATGSTTTYTTTLGSTAHVSDTAQSSSGSTNSQVASVLTMPRDGTITKVAAYFAGYGGSCVYKMALWSASSGALLNESTSGTASSAAFAAGNSVKYERALTSSRFVASGASVWAGFLRTSSGDGFQWDRDDGSGKTTKRDDHLDGNMSDPATDTSTKPNVYVTYTYDVDTRLETAAMIGVATDGTYIYTLDTDGVVWKYDRTTGAHVAHSAVQTAITGTKSKAGMFYDATAAELIITTTTGTGAGVYPKFVRVNTSTLAVSSTVYSAAAGTTFNGTTDSFRGGARLADPLNASAATYWIATTNKVYAYTFSGTTATQTSDRDFGLSTTVGDGLLYDTTNSQFVGWDSASPTVFWKFTGWDWTTASAIYWACYSWYDSAGTTHETAVGPRASLTLRRRERLTVTNAAIPTGGADDPDKVRIYFKPNATDPGAGNFKLQVTDALTSRIFTTYDSAGAADGGGTAFPSGTPAQIKSAGTGWTLKGSGFINKTGTSFPGSPATGDHYYRSDLGMEFRYDGTRWLSVNLFYVPMLAGDRTVGVFNVGGLSATTASFTRVTIPLMTGLSTDIYVVDYGLNAFVNGGTALGASHKWVVTFNKSDSAGALTVLATINIDSGASSVMRRFTAVAINAVVATGTFFSFNESATKTGTPGNLLGPGGWFTYRVVAT